MSRDEAGHRPAATLPAALRGSRPQALLLDFDGVIVASVQIKVDAYLRIYDDATPAQRDAILGYQRAHAGMTRRLKFRHFEAHVYGRPADEARIEALSAAYTRLVHGAVLGCPLVEGAAGFLDRTRGRSALHIVSGTPQEELDDIVVRRGLRHAFVSVRGAPATKHEAFAAILAGGGHAPAHTLAIGDGATEREAAAALGIPFLGIVPDGEPSPFPRQVPTVRSLAGVAEALGF